MLLAMPCPVTASDKVHTVEYVSLSALFGEAFRETSVLSVLRQVVVGEGCRGFAV